MNKVKEERIKNTDIRKSFGNLQEIDYYVQKEPEPTLEKLSDNKKTAYLN
jgi:hypothetical protein